jgi:hypothetical protein
MRMTIGKVSAEARVEAAEEIPEGHSFTNEGEPGDVFKANLLLRFDSPISELRIPMRATSSLIAAGDPGVDCEMVESSFTIQIPPRQE